jgi:hypothetical protein
MGYVPSVGFATHRRATVRIHLHFKRLMFKKTICIKKKKKGRHTSSGRCSPVVTFISLYRFLAKLCYTISGPWDAVVGLFLKELDWCMLLFRMYDSVCANFFCTL